MDNNRHDRNAHLHSHVEATFLEGGELSRWCARPFRGNHHRLAVFAHSGNQWFHRFDSLFPIGSIDKDGARHAHDLTNKGHLFYLFFTDSHDVFAN